MVRSIFLYMTLQYCATSSKMAESLRELLPNENPSGNVETLIEKRQDTKETKGLVSLLLF